jgi:fructokinase
VSTTRPTIVGIGEILWDVFPDGPQFGGAPANFACTAAELTAGEMDVFAVGSVGRDDLGTQAIKLLKSHGVNISCVSTTEFPTGRVNVTLDDAGVPSFEIATNTAWDNVPWSSDLAQLAARADAVCFGTLAQRSPLSRATIRKFLEHTRPDCLRILDINLRPPFWNEAVVVDSLQLANILKLNDTEIEAVLESAKYDGRTLDELTQIMMDKFLLDLTAITRGPDGATLIRRSGERSDQPSPPTKVVDTVGAGDAFTAALTIGLLNGAALDDINAWAIRVAAFVCTQAGGTPHFPAELRFSKK